MAGGIAVFAAILMAACGSGSQAPTSPSATALSGSPALGGHLPESGAAITIPTLPSIAVSLKASSPVAQSPATDTILRDATLQLVVESPVGTFVSAALLVTFELFKITNGSPVLVHSQSVAAGQPNTSVTIPPATLVDRQEYAWRAYASLDGATGSSSTPFAFQTEFIVIDPPTLRYPIGGETATDHQPPLLMDNGAVQGNPGTVTYKLEVGRAPTFPNPRRIDAIRTGDTGDRTTGLFRTELLPLTTYYWRVRGTNGTVVGEWSPTETFRTPDENADAIDPKQVVWLHTDVSDWEVDSEVTGVTITPHEVCVFHTAAGTWPTSEPIGPGELEGNIWIFGFVNGRWYGATWDWLRPGQECKGATAEEFGADQIRIPPLDASWVPRSGDRVGFMMSTIARSADRAGELRSNIAVVTWP